MSFTPASLRIASGAASAATANVAGVNVDRPKLLNLGFAFPPGMQSAFVGVNPAGHLFETEMISALREFCDIKSVGLLPDQAAVETRVRAQEPRVRREQSDGVDHDLILADAKPEVLARWRAASQLQHWYESIAQGGWKPDAVLAYNLSPVYNHFIRALEQRADPAKRVLLLADSSSLGQDISQWKRFRRRFKPMHIPDEDAIKSFNACIGLSPETKRFFPARPWIWMPGACAGQALPHEPVRRDGPIRFAYFGALAAHSGIMDLINAFLSLDLPIELAVCGYGKLSHTIASIAREHPRLRFAGQLSSNAECLRFGAAADVLVNPRPATHGNENNFPSKLFQYALTGRTILTSRISGTEEVLGPEAFYFNERDRLPNRPERNPKTLEAFCFDGVDFDRNIREALLHITTLPREELDRRGKAIQQRVLAEYNWRNQAQRMSEFIQRLLQ